MAILSAVAVWLLLPTGAAFTFSTPLHRGTLLHVATDPSVENLLEKAARLRQEIAELEGKTLEQVQQEAKDKRELEEEALRKSKEVTGNKTFDKGRMLSIPETTDQMISQAARAIEMAFKDGITRQTVRFALLEEGASFTSLPQWPGGAQQMYRESAKPLTVELLKNINTSNQPSVVQPKVKDQDVWDFDGSALLTAEAHDGPAHDVQALVFPNTDVKYVKDIEKIDQAIGDRLFVLINPFWRNLESWGINLLSPGAKKMAKQVIFDKGYPETYVFLRFSVRGELCAAIKCYPYDWQIFAYLEDETGWERAIRLGSSETEPTSDLVTKLLNERPEFKLTKVLRQLRRDR
jgi:hypothetical protein